MIGKILGAIVGSKLAKSQPGGLQGTGGALAGMGVAALVRRLGPVGLVAAAVGGYALSRYRSGKGTRKPGPTA